MTEFTNPHPLVQAGPEDEAQQPGIIPDLQRNWAEDADTVDYVINNVVNMVMWTRQQRQPQELEWQEIRRLGLLKHDANQKYVGRSNAYIPTYLHARDVLVTNLTRGLFPSDDFMDVVSTDLGVEGQDQAASEEQARKVKNYLQYELEKSAKLRSRIKPMLKQYIQYGIGVAKVWYHKDLKSLGRVKRKADFNGMPQMELAKDLGREGVRFQARDIFSVYVWPPTVDTLEEASMVFEDIDLPLWYIKEMSRKKKWANADLALAAVEVTEHNYNRQQFQVENMNESTIPTQNPPPGGDLAQWRTLTEVYVQMPLPREAYVGDEEIGSAVACRLLITGNTVLEVRRQPFWHGRLPYLMPRMVSEPGQFYPKGTGFTAKYLQYLINDFTNQINDNMTYGLNPITLVNPSTLVGPLSPIKPGAIWQTTDTANGIRFEKPPVEQIQYGQGILSSLTSTLNDNIGAPPIIQGTNAGKGARTATSSQILQKNASSPLQDMVEDLENEVMIPLMEMAHSLGTQYRTEDVNILVDGKAERISPQELIKDCQYRWLASSQSANQQQRTQQLLMLLQSLMPLVPLLQQQGKQLNVVPILKKVWTNGLGQRGFDEIIQSIPQQPGMPGMPGGQPQPGESEAGLGPQDMQMQDPNQDMNPSGNEDFAEVRDGADDIAAMAGEFGGEI